MSTLYTPFTHNHYRYILQSALKSGYKFIDFPSLKRERQGGQFFCLLRHDCDNDLTAAATIAEIETEMGVHSTYFLMLRSVMYNLMSIPNTTLVRKIIDLGHWIGLHFDEHYYPNATPNQVATYIDRERTWLSEEFGVSVDVVSFHQPSQRVLDNRIKLNSVDPNLHRATSLCRPLAHRGPSVMVKIWIC
jgi:hypothetical protein